jgi:hypothetical protein
MFEHRAFCRLSRGAVALNEIRRVLSDLVKSGLEVTRENPA